MDLGAAINKTSAALGGGWRVKGEGDRTTEGCLHPPPFPLHRERPSKYRVTVAPSPQRLQGWLIAASILLIPVGWSPFPWNIQWGDWAVLGLLITMLINRDITKFVFHPVDALVALYLLGSLASLSGTLDLVQSGLELTKHFYLGMVYVVFSVIASRREMAIRIAWWCSVAAGLSAAIGLLALLVSALVHVDVPGVGQRIAVPIVGEVYRPQGALHTPELLGDYLTFSLPLLIGFAMASRRIREATWCWVWVSVAAIAALCTVSRSLGGAIAAGLIITWRVWSAGWRRFVRWAWLVLLAGALIGIQLVSVASIREVSVAHGTNPAMTRPAYHHVWYDERIGAQAVRVTISYHPMGYYLLKRVAWDAFLRHPLTGIGAGGFNAEAERAYQAGRLSATFRAADPHSTWFGRLAETGLVGVATLVLLWGGFLRRGLRLTRQVGQEDWMPRAVFAGLVGLLINSLNVDLMNFRFVWVGFGLLRREAGLSDPQPG